MMSSPTKSIHPLNGPAEFVIIPHLSLVEYAFIMSVGQLGSSGTSHLYKQKNVDQYEILNILIYKFLFLFKYFNQSIHIFRVHNNTHNL